ncbi:MAG: PilZ domain-containing protein [Clostridia bacterium]|nr:PilZ domain-containing protein [Clostridia bacterium]
MEDRIQPRVIFHVSASLEFNGHDVNGNVENLSLSGMLINTTDNVPENTEGEVTVYLSGSSSELSLNMSCEVIFPCVSGRSLKRRAPSAISRYFYFRGESAFSCKSRETGCM